MLQLRGDVSRTIQITQTAPDLMLEFTVLCLGTDDVSAALWAWLLVDQQIPQVKYACQRACYHWESLTEDHQMAIGPIYGLGEPHGERNPLPARIANDYQTLLSFMTQIFDDEPMR